jgi:hypothetical protein
MTAINPVIKKFRKLTKLLHQRRTREVESLCCLLLKEYPFCPWLLNIRAMNIMSSNEEGDFPNVDEAVRCLRIAYSINPRDLSVMEELAEYYYIMEPEKFLNFKARFTKELNRMNRSVECWPEADL